jgi:hypothetical protein
LKVTLMGTQQSKAGGAASVSFLLCCWQVFRSNRPQTLASI